MSAQQGHDRRKSLVRGGLTAAILVVSLGLSVPVAALADSSPAVDQYAPALPLDSGTHHPGSGRARSATGSSGSVPASPLPAPVVRALARQPSATRRALRRIATSPELGAPPNRAHSRIVPPALDGGRGALSAASDAFGPAIPILLLALAIIGIAGGVVATRRRRVRAKD